ncbi:MAG: FtsX-like permease family protein [Saprospiraceae bacterium]
MSKQHYVNRCKKKEPEKLERKALGATPPSIINMIITESMVLTGFAGYLGLITGVVVLYLVNWFLVSNSMESEFFRNPGVNFWAVFSAPIFLGSFAVVAVIGYSGIASCKN